MTSMPTGRRLAVPPWLRGLALLLLAHHAVAPAQTPVNHAPVETLQRGEYLAHAGDCVACHTQHDGQPFAGGLPMLTPFGNLYSPNITPDA